MPYLRVSKISAKLQESRRLKQEAVGSWQEAGGRRQEAGSRKQEAGSRKQEAGGTEQSPLRKYALATEVGSIVETRFIASHLTEDNNR